MEGRTIICSGARALAVLLLLGVGCAHAGRPLTTDDAAVIAHHKCEAEGFSARVAEAGAPTLNLDSLQLSCGAGADTQLALGVQGDRSDGATERGLRASGKTALHLPTEAHAGIAIAYAISGIAPAGEGFHLETTELNAALSVPLGAITAHVNAGWIRFQPTRRNIATWALALEAPAAVGPVDLMAETYGDDRVAPWLAVAARWSVVRERFFLDASYGVQANGGHAKLITVGFKWAI